MSKGKDEKVEGKDEIIWELKENTNFCSDNNDYPYTSSLEKRIQ